MPQRSAHRSTAKVAAGTASSKAGRLSACEDRIICGCDCGGTVHGVDQFDRLWTWCDKCSPVVKLTLPSS